MSDLERVAAEAMADEGLSSHSWSNEAGFRYPAHEHDYHKVLFCLEGSITFHTPTGDVELSPGDRLDLPAGTPHGATVGPDGVCCVEAGKAEL